MSKNEQQLIRAAHIPMIADLAAYPNGSRVTVAGLLVVRQAPHTAKGVVFLTLEDEAGFINVVLYPAVYEAHRSLLQRQVLLLVRGHVQRQDSVINIVAETLAPYEPDA